MELVEHTLDASLDEFLSRPLFCFLATATTDGRPRVSPLWFLWEEGFVWTLGDTVGKSYTARVARRSDTAVAVVDFDVARGRVRHVGMRGSADLVPFDEDRSGRLLRRYLGDDQSEWDPRFVGLDGERWNFVRFDPETVVARDQSFAPSLDPN